MIYNCAIKLQLTNFLFLVIHIQREEPYCNTSDMSMCSGNVVRMQFLTLMNLFLYVFCLLIFRKHLMRSRFPPLAFVYSTNSFHRFRPPAAGMSVGNFPVDLFWLLLTSL